MRWWVLALALLACAAWAADWPQFRGPVGTGLALDPIRADWRAQPPKTRWTVALTDNGFAGPAVSNSTVYIIDHKGTDDIVRALDLRTGRERWRYSYPDAKKDVYGFARATPAVTKTRVYTLSREGKVLCLDARTGARCWQRDLVADFHGVRPQWGYAMSPYLDGGRLIVCPGGKGAAVAALDAATGATIWQGGGDDAPGYATPTLGILNGKRQYIIFAGAALLGVDAETGALCWRVPWTTELHPTVDTPIARAHFNANAAVPLVQSNTTGCEVFITTGYGHGSALIDVSADGAKIRWESKAMQSQYSSPVERNGFVYCTSDPNLLVCLEKATGKLAWKMAGFGRGGGVVAAGEAMVVMDGATGDAVLVRMSRGGYKELGRIRPLPGENRTAPIIADGCLLVRNRKALACVELR
jgi:outer membrane protein assembly factor BamB